MPNTSKNLKIQQGFIHLLPLAGITLTLAIISIFASANIQTTTDLSKSDIQGIMLAKGGDDGPSSGSGSSDSDDSRSDNSGSSGSGSSGSGNSGSSGSSDSGSTDTTSNSGPSTTSNSGSSTTTTTKTESKPSSSTTPGVRTKTEQSIQKQKTEIRFSEEEKIKTEVKNDRTRVDVYSGGIKVRYETRDGRVIIKAETEEGEGVPEQELFKIDDRLSKDGIKVSTEGGKLVIARNNIGALSNFPLQIDLNTNNLIASTSAGTKILTTLPDQAVQNMLAANIISRLNTQDLVSQAQSGALTSVQDIVTLGEKNGVPVYEINGIKEHKLLGFIPISTQTKVFVSAETGQPISQEQSLLSQIIDLLSR